MVTEGGLCISLLFFRSECISLLHFCFFWLQCRGKKIARTVYPSLFQICSSSLEQWNYMLVKSNLRIYQLLLLLKLSFDLIHHRELKLKFITGYCPIWTWGKCHCTTVSIRNWLSRPMGKSWFFSVTGFSSTQFFIGIYIYKASLRQARNESWNVNPLCLF